MFTNIFYTIIFSFISYHLCLSSFSLDLFHLLFHLPSSLLFSLHLLLSFIFSLSSLVTSRLSSSLFLSLDLLFHLPSSLLFSSLFIFSCLSSSHSLLLSLLVFHLLSSCLSIFSSLVFHLLRIFSFFFLCLSLSVPISVCCGGCCFKTSPCVRAQRLQVVTLAWCRHTLLCF